MMEARRLSKVHPKIRASLRRLLVEDLGERRAKDVLLAVDFNWTLLKYGRGRRQGPPTEEDYHVVASLTAGVLEAERISGGAGPKPWKRRVSQVKLRLVQGGQT